MHFPLSFHPKADIYARVFEAGMALGSNFYEELFSTTKEFDQKSDDEIIEYFAAKTSDVAKFKELVANEDIKNKIQSHMQKAQSLGVTGTPALYFNGKFVGGYKPPMYDMAIELFNK
jgi:protein-disulfide isomerase